LLRLQLLPLLGAIACTSCTHSAANGPSAPVPLTAADTVTRLVLDTALITCPGTAQKSVLISARGGLNTAGLSTTRHKRLVWLSAEEIQRYADDHGDVSYWEVYPASVRGDSARVSVTKGRAFQRPNRQSPIVRDGGTYCVWLVVRRHGAWVVAALGNVIDLR